MGAVEDIHGQKCMECRKGTAILGYDPRTRHYFFGCSSFKTRGCKGPRAWQPIQVPQHRRLECDEAFKRVEQRASGARGAANGFKWPVIKASDDPAGPLKRLRAGERQAKRQPRYDGSVVVAPHLFTHHSTAKRKHVMVRCFLLE